MNWAIHTKGPTPATNLRAALESERDAILGSEKAEAERQAQIAKLKAAADAMPPSEALDALLAAHARLAAVQPSGIQDKALRDAVDTQITRGIDAACDLAIGHVNVTISGSASSVDEDIEERISVNIDKVDLKALSARLAREAPAEKVITEGSVTAPPA